MKKRVANMPSMLHVERPVEVPEVVVEGPQVGVQLVDKAIPST